MRNRFNVISCAVALFFLSNGLVFAEVKEGGVFYEIFVRSFYDSDSDGIGDFNGLIEKLDYLNDGNPWTKTDLGIEGIWLMPILESPSYHGYDVVDYYKIERDYGTEKDFQRFIAEAHRRGIKIIMDLVLNHTSSKHPWFIDSCRAKSYRKDWYVWQDVMPKGWTKPRGGGTSRDVWHYRNGSYYYAAFGAHMPDLNYRNEEVIEQMEAIMKYWLDKGIDGFRLDGVRYLVEKGGGLSGQADLKETHKVLKRLAGYAKGINKECMLIGEVWAGNEVVSRYYNKGDELDGAFNFELARAIINSIRFNNYRQIENVLNEMTKYRVPMDFYSPFLTNHDQNRIASELNGDEQKLKLAAGLLLSMRGTPFIYYGEEIGMKGEGHHERIRTPMQWDDSKNAGFTKGKPWEGLQDDFRQVNIKSQENNENSLLNYYKKLIRIRKKYWKLLKGKRRLIRTNNDKIYAYIYVNDKEGLLFIHNFKDVEVKNIKLEISEVDFSGEKYKVVNLLDNNTQSIIWLNSDEFKINSLERYGSLVLMLY